MLSYMFRTMYQAKRVNPPQEDRKVVTTIPDEVIRRVLSYLYYDHQTLKTCSLVSKEWVDFARYHIFFQKSIAGSGAFFLSPDLPEKLASMPSVAKHVQDLYLTSNTTGSYARLHRYAFLSIVSQLPSLKTIHLEGMSWEMTLNQPPSPHALLQIPRALESVRLRLFTFSSIGWGSHEIVLNDFFSTIPFIQHLDFMAVAFSPSSVGPEPPSPTQLAQAPLSLKSLRLNVDSFSLRLLYNTLQHSNCDQTLRSLDIRITDSISCEPLQELIYSCGSNITHVRLNLSSMDPHYAFDLSDCSRLNTICVGLYLQAFNFSFNSWSWVIETISRCRQTLRTVIFNVEANGDEEPLRSHLRLVNWEALDSTLSGFHDLSSVVFVRPDAPTTFFTCSIDEFSWVRAQLCRSLPRAQRKGILRFGPSART